MNKPHVFIIGGGLSGLISGIYLQRNGLRATLMERKQYPFHRVCGEYISKEVLPFLNSLDINPYSQSISEIENLEVSSTKGRIFKQKLDLGGFGISRSLFDSILASHFQEMGGTLIQDEKINSVKFQGAGFELLDSMNRSYEADMVIGAYGKRSNLDPTLNRSFFHEKSPFIGVKYHIQFPIPRNLIQLHNFKNGYAGISAIEDNLVCLCYLSHRSNLKEAGTIPLMEKNILQQNPFLQSIFNEAKFLWDKPLVINEISFSKKELVKDHILFAGDSAGLISPLCGNGMAMAIHSAKILGDHILEFGKKPMNMKNREHLEKKYEWEWNKFFKKRLWVGRQIQNLFGNDFLTDYALSFLNKSPKIAQLLIQSTHGNPF